MQSNTEYRRIIYVGVIIIFLEPGTAVSNNVSAFRLTGIEGNIAIQQHSDEQIQQGSRNELTTTEEEFSFLTHSYVYHPNLLNIDFGAGLIYTQNELETTNNSSEYDDDLYSLTARLSFLEKKPYPFTLFYDRTNPSVSVSISERFIQENEKYGVNASLLEPLLPFSMNLAASRQTQAGHGTTQILNNTTDQIQWRAYRSLGQTGHGQLTYNSTRYHSENGVVGQPIEEKQIGSESVSLDTYFDFGTRRQFNFYNLISYFTQDNLPAREEFRWTPNLSWRHTEATSSFYRFDYYNSKVENSETLTRSGVVGFRSDLTETVAVSGDLHGEDIETTGLSNQVRGVTGNISYARPLSFGRLSLSAGSRYDENERDSSLNFIDKKAESTRLDGLQKVALAFPHVTAVTRVIHADPARQHIILQKGIDYEIELPPPPDREGPAYIRRLGTINLESGESVLVDYTYQSGGSVTFTSFNQNYYAQLDLFNYYSIYVSYSDTDTELKEGLPTIPVSSTTLIRSGARVDHPFFHDELTLGAEAIRDEREDEFSPYIRKTYETYIQARFFSDTRLRLTSRRVIQDNQNSNQDVDLRRQSARLTLHPLPRASLSLEVSNEKDTGGTIPRRIKQTAIIGQWRIRKLVFSLDGRSVVETQGTVEREHNVFMARLNREF